MITDCHASVRIQIAPPDPLHCRRAADHDEMVAQARSWAARQQAIHEGRTPFEAHIVGLRVYREELAVAAVKRQGGLGR